eukprot:373409_1
MSPRVYSFRTIFCAFASMVLLLTFMTTNYTLKIHDIATHTFKLQIRNEYEWTHIQATHIPGFVVARHPQLALSKCDPHSRSMQKCIQTLKQLTLTLGATSFSSDGDIKIHLKPQQYWKPTDSSFITYYLRHSLGPWCYLNDTRCTDNVSLNKTPNKLVPSHLQSITKGHHHHTHCSTHTICIPSVLVPSTDAQSVLLQRIMLGAEFVHQNIRIIIGILIKDEEGRIHKIHQLLTQLGQLFMDYRIVFIENDSTDEFVQILRNDICANNTQIICMNFILHFQSRVKEFGKFSEIRLRSMAFLRNMLLEYVMSYYFEWDYMMVIDADELIHFNVQNKYKKQTSWPWSVMTSFSGESRIFDDEYVNGDWDVMCSNGMAYGLNMWDNFPYVSKFVDAELVMSDIDFVEMDQRNNNTLKPKWWKIANEYHIEFIPVYSCFGPYSIYRIDALKGCKYEYQPDTCEHLTLHNCLARHNKSAYVNPFMFGYKHSEHVTVDNDVCVCHEARVNLIKYN